MPQKVQCLEMGRSSTWISRCSRVTGCWLKIFKDLQGIRKPRQIPRYVLKKKKQRQIPIIGFGSWLSWTWTSQEGNVRKKLSFRFRSFSFSPTLRPDFQIVGFPFNNPREWIHSLGAPIPDRYAFLAPWLVTAIRKFRVRFSLVLKNDPGLPKFTQLWIKIRLWISH